MIFGRQNNILSKIFFRILRDIDDKIGPSGEFPHLDVLSHLIPEKKVGDARGGEIIDIPAHLDRPLPGNHFLCGKEYRIPLSQRDGVRGTNCGTSPFPADGPANG